MQRKSPRAKAAHQNEENNRDAARLELRRRGRDAALRRLELRCRKTKNPLYVFEAIALCNMAEYPACPLPDWCLQYVVTLACEVLTLGKLRDPRDYPIFAAGESEESYESRIEEWRNKPCITPQRAAELVPQIMSLTGRRGWNAFARYASDKTKQMDVVMFAAEASRDDRKATADMMKRRNIEAGSVCRRLQQGRAISHPEQKDQR